MADEKTNIPENAIIFRMGEETGIVIEKTEEQFEHSLFREQYRQAFSIIDDLINRTTTTNSHKEIDENVSNVLAFCGDRGEGKTSALTTVRGILLDEGTYGEAKDAKLFPQEMKKLKSNSFKVLKLIDPAFFDNKHNLLELLVGQMYSEVKQYNSMMAKSGECDELCTSGDLVKHKNLVKYFQKVRTSLAIINKASEKNAYDNLEEIDELAAGIELKENLRCLLKLYADYFHKDRVLICIDDLDLNITEGYLMCEEIRKYLSLPDVCLVLMAIKVNQMIEVVQSYLRDHLTNIITEQAIIDMSTRYVAKLLPESHRILMPSGEEIVERPLKIAGEADKEPYPPVKEVVVQQIYLKTRYIFVNGRNISPIVPLNLRAIRHLLGMLYVMPNAKLQNGSDNLKNKEDFRAYFYTSWKEKLTDKNRKFVEALEHNEDLVSINKSVVMHLRELLQPDNDAKQGSIEITDDILRAIVNPLNAMQNVSLGDAFYAMNYVENVVSSAEIKTFIYYLRAYYSIKLYDTYNLISESESALFPNPDGKISIYKYDTQLQKRNLLQRLINGSYFTYKAGSLMPSDARHTPRDRRIINGRELINLFKSLTPDSSITQWKLCEFLALTTICPAYAYSDVEYDRIATSRSYYEPFTGDQNFMVFDALSIFYYIVNIKHTYKRWNDVYNLGKKDTEIRDFYQDALNKDGSLLKEMLSICEDKHHWSPETKLENRLHYFVSEAIIRFSEVQLTILDNLVNSRDLAKTGGNLFNLYNSYKYIRGLGIKLYPIHEEEYSYDMEFWFLKPVVEFLSDPKQISETAFNKVFQIEVTKPSIVKTIERAFGGTVLGLDATKSVSGKELIKRINGLENIDLLETLELDTLFEEDEMYNRNDVIAILSQYSKFEELRNISVSIKTRDDAIQKAKDEATKIADKNLKDIKDSIKPLSNNFATLTQELKAIRKSQDEEKKNREAQIKQIEKHIAAIEKESNNTEKKGRPKKASKSEANGTTIVVVEPKIEEPVTTEK